MSDEKAWITDRCIDGRLMRHKPFPDDPDFEHDMGECPECGGAGCDRSTDIANQLYESYEKRGLLSWDRIHVAADEIVALRIQLAEALALLKQAEQRLVYWMAEARPNETAGDEQRTQTMIDTNPVIMAIRALDER